MGGIIVAIAKMCIKGKKGIELRKPKYLINQFEYFFGEDQGRYIIEIDPKDQKTVMDVLDKNSVHYDEIGVINGESLVVDDRSKVSIDELILNNNNWLDKYMR